MRAVAVLVVALAACTANTQETAPTATPSPSPTAILVVSSGAFSEGEPIPAVYSCEGQNVSPPLSWSEVPDDAAELVLIVDDPDAPGGTFVHWVVYGISPAQGGVAVGRPPSGATLGRTSFGTTGYGGPCPPTEDGPHRYRFTVMAVSEPLGLAEGATAAEVEAAAEGVTLARATLTGTYDIS